jgi:hypothetical protein
MAVNRLSLRTATAFALYGAVLDVAEQLRVFASFEFGSYAGQLGIGHERRSPLSSTSTQHRKNPFVLELEMPKSAQAKSTRVEVKTARTNLSFRVRRTDFSVTAFPDP